MLSQLHAGIQPSDRSSASGTDGDVRRQYGDILALDLRSCRLSDRELQVLLHAIMKRSSRRHGEGSTEEAPFNKLLLSGNPKLSVGGLTALWGPRNSDVGVAEGCPIGSGLVSGTTSLLFQSLVHLDLSKCGLTAPDLIGLAPPGAHHPFSPLRGNSDGVDVVAKSLTDNGNGHAAPDEPGVIDGVLVPGGSQSRGRCAPVRCSIRVLDLSDNPLTRVGARRAGKGGAGGWGYKPELAERGMMALRLLIAGAPELEGLDVSGGFLSAVPTNFFLIIFQVQKRTVDRQARRNVNGRLTEKLSCFPVPVNAQNTCRVRFVRTRSCRLNCLSGCSQLPEGPSARLYSTQVSEYLASALAAGFEGRLASIAANRGGYHRSGGGGRHGDDGDGRVQVNCAEESSCCVQKRSFYLMPRIFVSSREIVGRLGPIESETLTNLKMSNLNRIVRHFC